MQDIDFKKVFNKISAQIIIAEPVYSDEKKDLSDFRILFINEAFSKKFENLAKEGGLFSKFSSELSKDLDLISFGSEVIKTGTSNVCTIFSNSYSCWLKISIDVSDELLIVTFANADRDKLYEEQLKNQNARLSNLTEELFASRENLRGNLDRINALNAKLEFTAYHDSLTGLHGRVKLEDDFSEWLKDSQGTESKFGLMVMGIDNMKLINDFQGRAKGDRIICKFAEILKRLEKEDIRFYRLNGDEFVALYNHVASNDTIVNMGDTLLEICNAEGFGFSGGISMYPDDGTNFEDILRFADMAMLDAKKKGKNTTCFFQAVMRERFMRKLIIQNKLSAAFNSSAFQTGFELHYQPQFDAVSNKLRGFEALLRWEDDELGWINPEQFIPIAEETRLVIPLGDWVMETAIKTLSDWQKNYSFDGIMSVNVSPVQLKKATFIFDLSTLIEQYDIRPETLEIEITEGVFIENKDEILGLLNQIRAMGIGISLDDFGTGYSSLSYLQLLPITTLKIDKSFISNIAAENGVEANITDSIISMVTKMGLDTIAEGVEKPEQLNILRSINCRNIQGFLKGKPMSKNRCEQIFKYGYESAEHL